MLVERRELLVEPRGSFTVKAAPARAVGAKRSSVVRRAGPSLARSPPPPTTSRVARPPSAGIAMPANRAVATARRSTEEARLRSL